MFNGASSRRQRGLLRHALGLVLSIACGCASKEEIRSCSELNSVDGLVVRGSDSLVTGGAVEFAVLQEPHMGLVLGNAPLPDPLSGEGYRTAGSNLSDDLFLYVMRPIQGLAPGARYRARFCVTAATQTRADSYGQQLHLKTGVVSAMPERIVDTDHGEPYYLLSVDKGRTAMAGGKDALYAGILGKEGDSPGHGLVTRQPFGSIDVVADGGGMVWLFAGVESTFEGWADVYWLELEIELNPLER